MVKRSSLRHLSDLTFTLFDYIRSHMETLKKTVEVFGLEKILGVKKRARSRITVSVELALPRFAQKFQKETATAKQKIVRRIT